MTCQWRAVNPVKRIDSGCIDVDPKTTVGQQVVSAFISRTKLCQLVLNVTVSDARYKIIWLFAFWLSFRSFSPWAIGPETNVDVIITLTEFITHHLCGQNYLVACKQLLFPFEMCEANLIVTILDCFLVTQWFTVAVYGLTLYVGPVST